MYSEEKEMERVTITIQKKFLAELEAFCDARQVTRSEVTRDALREYLRKEAAQNPEWTEDGFLIIAFNHHQKGLLDQLTDIEHDAGVQIYSTMHVHVSADNCSEVIALRGAVGDVQEFVEKVRAVRGILFCELVPLYSFPETETDEADGHGHHHDDTDT
jgi:CopG family nickel-responsive transcriptional regulator